MHVLVNELNLDKINIFDAMPGSIFTNAFDFRNKRDNYLFSSSNRKTTHLFISVVISHQR